MLAMILAIPKLPYQGQGWSLESPKTPHSRRTNRPGHRRRAVTVKVYSRNLAASPHRGTYKGVAEKVVRMSSWQEGTSKAVCLGFHDPFSPAIGQRAWVRTADC